MSCADATQHSPQASGHCEVAADRNEGWWKRLKGRPRKVRHIAVIAAVIALGGWVGYCSWYNDELIVEPPAYCPTDTWPQRREGIKIPGHTAILIDTSNRIPDPDSAFERIDALMRSRESMPSLQRVSVFGLPESETVHRRSVPRLGSWCVPKTGEEANLIYQNPIYVEAQFRRFVASLRDRFRELLERDEASVSPIVETMAALVQPGDEPVHPADSLDSIVLVSDMLQNTSAWSHYGEGGDTTGIDRACRRIGGGGLEEVFVYYINRDIDVQSPEWPNQWWATCLHGVRLRVLN